MGRKNKPRLIPEQDKRICGSICLCQLTIVLSCVSIVYLSVAIYLPSYKAFQSGFEATPVMCQTINTTIANNCPWASCGEWCLTKTGGFCTQIHSTVRRNGTDIQLENCTRIATTACPQVKPEAIKKFNCNNGTECAVLSGVFNCSLGRFLESFANCALNVFLLTPGHCKNMSELYLCHHKADGGVVIDAEKDNLKLNGFFECVNSKCTKIKKPFSCDRYCPKITTAVNVLIMQDDNLVSAECDVGFAYNEARGKESGVRLATPKKVWDETMGVLLTSCHDVIKDGDKLRATDCLNGTLLKQSELPHPFMNFTQFWKIYENSNEVLDPNEIFLPKQSSVTIYNSSKLFINLEGCVNTLRGECNEFVAMYGRDGDNNTAQSRFQCYYNKHNSAFVVLRFDLNKTWRELLIAVCVPVSLFVISFIALCIITKSVKVGDDSKMRCKYCAGETSDVEDNNFASKSNHNINCPMESHEPCLPPSDQPSAPIDSLPTNEDQQFQCSTKSLKLSPCTETTEKSLSVSATFELKETDNRPLVEF
ncbi:hypothetical protein Bhyg_15114 [Pseudolycoriella hygida]|uniref:Uncharacterized protein n=1 Tax=Pseudolycoriella hygida TaxID=35572 RepID=A0A9Q0RY51_9DIPT|nr:hypothetical protein Bhyg_15114 [Pseudolycoriella hygida]